jgi:2,5-dioxopentanoate dehydrogenase
MEFNITEILTNASLSWEKYRNIGREKRAQFLESIAQEIENLGDELIMTVMKESHLPEARVRGERGRTTNQILQFAEWIRDGSYLEVSMDPAISDRPTVAKPDIRKINIPLGPVVVFGASNFPLAFSTAGGDTASALAAGCPVVVKGHPAHVETSNMVAHAISIAVKKNNMPLHVFQHVTGGIDIGRELVMHPMTKAVGFTGSYQGGKALFDMAAGRPEPIPVFAEMGSVNPVIVMEEYLKSASEKLAATLAGSITLGVGQFCTNPGLIFGVKSPSWDTFKTQLAAQMKAVHSGIMLTQGISENYKKTLGNHLACEDVHLLASGLQENENKKVRACIAYTSATQFLNTPALAEEVFGPFSLIIECSDIMELHTCIRNLKGQLSSSIWATEEELHQNTYMIDLMAEKAGRLIVNAAPTGVEVCPSMHHGGPFPATTDGRFTSVGTDAIKRWLRPVVFQSFPDALLPEELQNSNPQNIARRVNGVISRDKI